MGDEESAGRWKDDETPKLTVFKEQLLSLRGLIIKVIKLCHTCTVIQGQSPFPGAL